MRRPVDAHERPLPGAFEIFMPPLRRLPDCFGVACVALETGGDVLARCNKDHLYRHCRGNTMLLQQGVGRIGAPRA